MASTDLQRPYQTMYTAGIQLRAATQLDPGVEEGCSAAE
jgi:hypothetical protein